METNGRTEEKQALFITHIIGNGFDVNLDIPTKYKDFLKYYKEQKNSDPEVQEYKTKFIQKSEKYELWKDLEIALGEYTSEFNTDDPPKNKLLFKKFYKDIRNCLKEYLTDVQSKKLEEFNDEEFLSILIDLIAPYRYLKDIDKRHKKLEDRLYLSIATFNYTTSIEEIIRERIGKLNPTKTGMYIYHIHGNIKKGIFLFGVDNKDQIKNEDFQNDEDILDIIVKPIGNSNEGSYKVRNIESAIHDSNIICIYGSSLGKTDQTWWNVISCALTSDEEVKLIFFHYIENLDEDDRYSEERKQRKRIMKVMSLEGKEEDYRKRIFVVINSEIFKKRKVDKNVKEHYIHYINHLELYSTKNNLL